MPWHLHLALKHLFPSGRPLSVFTLISVVGVSLGVAVLIVVLSVMGGFGSQVRQKIIEAEGDLRIEARGYIDNADILVELVAADPDVAEVAPYAQGIVLLQYDNRAAVPGVRGVDPEQESRISPLSDFLLVGTLDDLDDDSVFLSTGLAGSLGIQAGDDVDIFTPLMLERLKDDTVLLPRTVRVAGIFETGWHQVDANAMVTTLRLMQELYGLGDAIHGVTVRLRPGADLATVADRLQSALPGDLRVVTWMDRNRDFQFVLQLERTVMFFLLAVILLVSAFAITSSLWITVVRKTREIGVIMVMGGRSRDVALCFCWQGLLLGTAGTVLGLLLGVLLLHFRNDIVGAMIALTDSRQAMLQFYGFANLPVNYAARDFAATVAFALGSSTLAGLIPAWRASRLRPAEAIRHE